MNDKERRAAVAWAGRATGVLIGLWAFHYLACTIGCDTSLAYNAVDWLVRAVGL